MRWTWIDRIVQLERGKRCVAIKNVTLAEEVLHDHFPASGDSRAMPVMPNTLIIEGMAQTAGILVGHARDFQEKVILAKIGRATFTAAAGPGHSVLYEATLERIDKHGASTTGTVTRIDAATGDKVPLATINLTFSHIDQSGSDLPFPEHNFVFTDQFMDLLEQSGFGVGKG